MSQPEFLKVLPTDVARVGVLGALVLALIRYVTALASETNGRIWIGDVMWWRATHAEIGQALGEQSADCVRRSIVKLCAAGELESMPARRFPGDRAMAYRVAKQPLRVSLQAVDQPLPEIAESVEQPFRESAEHAPHIRRTRSANLRNVPISIELKERGEGSAPDPNPSSPATHGAFGPRCRKHRNVEKPGRCYDCGEANDSHRKAAAAYEAAESNRRAAVSMAIDNCPDCDTYGRLDDLSVCPKHANHLRGGVSA